MGIGIDGTAIFIVQEEDFDYSEWNEYFDLVFTSPPYFSVERYSHDDTQSWVRYKNIDMWNEQFLHKTLDKIIPTVKKGGLLGSKKGKGAVHDVGVRETSLR